MNDGEVTRQAIGISLATWCNLENQVKEATSDVEVLRLYIQSCPFVAEKSVAVVAVLEVLEKLQKKANNKSQRRTSPPSLLQKSAAKPSTLREASPVAMRITISVWSQLLVQSETMDEFQVLRLYIERCPYLRGHSNKMANETKLAALEALERANLEHYQDQQPPPLHGEEESDSEESHATKPASDRSIQGGKETPQQRAKSKLSLRRILIFVVRSVLLDLPMAVLFATYLALLWVQRVDQDYLQPSMMAAVWSPSRAEAEITYYHRDCDVRDLTTHNPNDLWIPLDATPIEAYEHQLRHGFSIFGSVLQENTTKELRDYVVSRNRQLSQEESIFVIENDNRYSFGLGTEEPAVANAVKELATHDHLVLALEKVLGSNPALIEMTAITSSYGAVDQYWHDDVIASGSAMKYGRAFGPSYSIFVQLQNTTAAMGATAVCPGSHKCADGSMSTYCNTHGFQAINTTTGYWKAGDALLMNMNSYHRGTAHVDPNAEDRVMLILTFVPRPQTKAESRQLSQGITFSLRWDMWGHTLYDLAHADTRMRQPWATLRALGLYKPKDAVWGVDYVSSAIMRMANEDNGFRLDELDTFLERGAFHWLPQFLNGKVTEGEGWHGFLLDTLKRCLEFIGNVNVIVLSVYIVGLVVLAVVTPKKCGIPEVVNSLLRTGIVYCLVYLLWVAANRHVDNTQWAKDIVNGRKYASAFQEEFKFAPRNNHLPSTLPHSKDVLIETRFGSRQLNMYNDWAQDHPGSQLFRKLVQEHAVAFDLVSSDLFWDATAEYIVGAVEFAQGRFLLQSANEWLWISRDDALDYTKAELAVNVHPSLNHIRREMRFLESEYKFGVHRATALARMSVVALNQFKRKLLSDTPVGKAIFTPLEDNGATKRIIPQRTMELVERHKLARAATKRPLSVLREQRRHINLVDAPTEPRFGQWLKSGDVIEGTEVLLDGEAHWYKGVLDKVTASGSYYCSYDDESYSIVTRRRIRAYKPYYVGEELEILLEDDMVDTATIVADHGDGTFDVFFDDEEEFAERVPTGDMRRLREGFMEEDREIRSNYA